MKIERLLTLCFAAALLMAAVAGTGSRWVGDVLYLKGSPAGAIVSFDGGTSQIEVCEHGYRALSTGAVTVTFKTAFASNPACNCTHINTTNANDCNIASATPPSTTQVGFAVASGGSDVINYICCGDK